MGRLKNACFLTLFLAAALWAPAKAWAKELILGGTGFGYPVIQILFERFQEQVPQAQLRLQSPPMGSNSALKALESGRLDMALSGRDLTREERTALGPSFELAETPFVLATRDGVRPGGLTLDGLADIYAARVRAWESGAPIRLILRSGTDIETLMLKSMSPSLNEAVDEALARPEPTQAVNDIEAARLIAMIPGSLGTTTLGLLTALDSRARTLPLNGVAPGIAALKDGSYPWRKRLSVVLPAKPSELALQFARYLRTPDAADILMRLQFLPLTP